MTWDFAVEYLCLLHEACQERDRHSGTCTDLNRKRRETIVAGERARRRAQIESDIAAPTGSAPGGE